MGFLEQFLLVAALHAPPSCVCVPFLSSEASILCSNMGMGLGPLYHGMVAVCMPFVSSQASILCSNKGFVCS